MKLSLDNSLSEDSNTSSIKVDLTDPMMNTFNPISSNTVQPYHNNKVNNQYHRKQKSDHHRGGDPISKAAALNFQFNLNDQESAISNVTPNFLSNEQSQ